VGEGGAVEWGEKTKEEAGMLYLASARPAA
jgi:hypothetical protein